MGRGSRRLALVLARTLLTRARSTKSLGHHASSAYVAGLQAALQHTEGAQREQSSNGQWWKWAAAGASVAALVSVAGVAHADAAAQVAEAGQVLEEAVDTKKGWQLLGNSFRRRVFFNYEKRIRQRSPPEKVFDYFASVREADGSAYMTPADLMRAVVAVFPPTDSPFTRSGSLRGERSAEVGGLQCAESELFKLFDTDGDGLISFAEYVFFVTLLSIPEADFAAAFRVFDLDGSGAVDAAEFRSVMAMMRARTHTGSTQKGGVRAVGKSLHGGPLDDAGVVKLFFGGDGNKVLKVGEFSAFLKALHEEITRLEFEHYDWTHCGSISGVDFALSMVAAADLSSLTQLVRRVDSMDKAAPNLKYARISYPAFQAFATLRHRRELLQDAIAATTKGKTPGITREEFACAAQAVCGVQLTDSVLDIIFFVFDVDGNGLISYTELTTAMDARERAASEQKWGLEKLTSYF